MGEGLVGPRPHHSAPTFCAKKKNNFKKKKKTWDKFFSVLFRDIFRTLPEDISEIEHETAAIQQLDSTSLP